MSAVDTTLPALGLRGLFVQRQADGSARVMITNGEPPLDTGANVRGDVTLTQEEWGALCAFGMPREPEQPRHGRAQRRAD